MRPTVARILAPAAAAMALGAVAAGCYDDYYTYEPAYPTARVYTAPRVYAPAPAYRPSCRRAWVAPGYDAWGRYHQGYWRCY